MDKVKVERIIGIIMIILSIFFFFSKRGVIGLVVFLMGLFMYIYSRKGTDYRSM